MAPAASLESIEDVARRELGETPATKQTALNELRKLIISGTIVTLPIGRCLSSQVSASPQVRYAGCFQERQEVLQGSNGAPGNV